MPTAPLQHVFPPPMERHYRVLNGRVQTRSLEAHIVDHCNLTCAECCSLSPLLPHWLADPQSLSRDLARAAAVLAPGIFKLVGGEPLLHPALVEILQRVRSVKIASVVSVTTNGLLLGRMPEAFWQNVDALTISLYPKPRLLPALIEEIEANAARFSVRLNWKIQEEFVQMTRDPPSEDAEQTRRTYYDCWIRERCHMIRDGIFYTCTRPAHFQALYRGRIDFTRDGVGLHEGAGMLEELLAYLRREQPLEACFHCRGGSAPLQPHRLMQRAEIEALKARIA
jgi:GTP 3',8-cyclase